MSFAFFFTCALVDPLGLRIPRFMSDVTGTRGVDYITRVDCTARMLSASTFCLPFWNGRKHIAFVSTFCTPLSPRSHPYRIRQALLVSAPPNEGTHGMKLSFAPSMDMRCIPIEGDARRCPVRGYRLDASFPKKAQMVFLFHSGFVLYPGL